MAYGFHDTRDLSASFQYPRNRHPLAEASREPSCFYPSRVPKRENNAGTTDDIKKNRTLWLTPREPIGLYRGDGRVVLSGLTGKASTRWFHWVGPVYRWNGLIPVLRSFLPKICCLILIRLIIMFMHTLRPNQKYIYITWVRRYYDRTGSSSPAVFVLTLAAFRSRCHLPNLVVPGDALCEEGHLLIRTYLLIGVQILCLRPETLTGSTCTTVPTCFRDYRENNSTQLR